MSPTLKRTARVAGMVLLVLAWGALLRPVTLGGPASYVIVAGNSMEPAMSGGALVVALPEDTYQRGDVIVYRVPQGEPGEGARVIHRIVGGSAQDGFRTRGDARAEADRWRPRPSDIDGAAVLEVPLLGRGALLMSAPTVLATLTAVLVFLTAGRELRVPAPLRRRAPAPRPAPPAVIDRRDDSDPSKRRRTRESLVLAGAIVLLSWRVVAWLGRRR